MNAEKGEHYDTVRVLNVRFPKLTPPLGLSSVWANKYPCLYFFIFLLESKRTVTNMAPYP